jgi:hypothetical protein
MEEHPDGDGVGDPANKGPDKGIKEEGQDLHEMGVKQRVGPVGIEKTIRAQAIL